MAMDKTTTRRMIGAIVLVLVAALVLAYLLKGKNNQPNVEKIHDVTVSSAPILSFPGSNDIGMNPSQDPTDTDKAGLNIVPDIQPKTIISGNNFIAGNTTTTPEKEAQAEKKKVQIASAKDVEDQAAAEETSKKAALKKADVVKLDNKDKVSSSEHKATKKKEDQPKPKLVGEKKLPKYSDKPKKEEPKKVEKPKEKEPATVKLGDADAIPTTGFSIQLFATTKKKKADNLQKQMRGEGYPAYITSIIKNAETLYRVRVGAYQEHEEADKIQARMKRRYLKNTNVQTSYVVTN